MNGPVEPQETGKERRPLPAGGSGAEERLREAEASETGELPDRKGAERDREDARKKQPPA